MLLPGVITGTFAPLWGFLIQECVMAEKKHVDHKKEEGEKRDGNEETLRHAGVENTAGDEKARSAAAENEKLHRDPPPLVHVDPSTGQVLSQPLDKGAEANRNTIPGDGGVKDARPNNGQVAPRTDTSRNPTRN